MLKIKTWLARRYDLRQLGHWFRGRWPKLFNGTSLQHFSPRVVVAECRYNRGKLNVSCCFASFFCFTGHEWKSILHASPTPSQFCPSFCSSASSSAVAKALFSLVGDGDCLGWALLPPRGWDSLFWAKVCFRHFKATRALAVACTHFLLLWTPRYELPLGGTELQDWNLLNFHELELIFKFQAQL